MQQSRIGKEVRLARRAAGRVSPDDFVVAAVAVPDPQPGQVLVRNQYFSVEPALRVFMDDSFGTPATLVAGQAIFGQAVGEVVASESDALPPGQMVLHRLGWREFALAGAADFEALPSDALPSPSFYLAPGLTAYVGLELANLQPGETVFVSSAAGAVGSLAGQMARLRGAGRVIGSVGSPGKIAMITEELGFDAALNYHDGHIADQLRSAAPNGIDVFFDNVGGEQLNAAMEVMRPGGRIMVCGWMGTQKAGNPPPQTPFNQMLMIGQGLRIIGFNTLDHRDRRPAYLADLRRWLLSGDIRVMETIVDGIDSAPQAFCDMLAGRYAGRVAIRC